jgi:hypothetical protein
MNGRLFKGVAFLDCNTCKAFPNLYYGRRSTEIFTLKKVKKIRLNIISILQETQYRNFYFKKSEKSSYSSL